MTIGQRIRRLRLEHGLSQEELGAKVGLQKAAINKYETGTVVNLKPAIVEGLAKALHTTPAYLMGWEDPFDGLPHSSPGDGYAPHRGDGQSRLGRRCGARI